MSTASRTPILQSRAGRAAWTTALLAVFAAGWVLLIAPADLLQITARLLAVGLLAAGLLTAARVPRAAALLCAGAALLAGTLWVTAMIASAASTEGRILPAVYAFTATLIAASAAWRLRRRGTRTVHP